MAENSDRITLRSLFSEILSVLNFERGMFYTLREITIRPRAFITSYLDGDRKRSVNPYRFLFLTTALAAFLSLTFVFNTNTFEFNVEEIEKGGIQFNFDTQGENTMPFDEAVAQLPDVEHQQKMISIMDRLAKFLNNWLNLLILLIIPIHALTCWGFFRKRKWNYAEFLTANCFIFSWANIFFIICVPLVIYDSSFLIWVFRIAALLVLCFMATSMRSRNWFRAILASIGSFFITLLLTGLVITLLIELFVVRG